MSRFFLPNAPRVDRERRRREFWFSVVVALVACAAVALILCLGYYKVRP